MAESSSPALPGDIEWLPGPGGGRVLRIHPSSAEPPALILRLAGGGEERVDARPSPATEYEIPGTLQWSAAWLQWPDGTRAAIPLPHGPHAEVIELRPRRERGAHTEGESAALRDDIAAPREDAASGEASERAEEAPVLGTLPAHSRAGAWTTPPQVNPAMGDAEAQWKARRAEVAHELGEAAAAIARARDGERSARDAVLAALATALADLRAARAAREADASTLAALTGELGAERAAHAVTRGSIGTLADALATARAELAEAKTREEAARAAIAAARAELTAARATGEAELAGARHEVTAARAAVASLREALEAERAARAAAEAALSERDDRPDVLQRVADLAAPRDQADLERRAREQADAAATAERRPAEEAATLLANLDAAAAALRAAVKPAGESPAATSPAADSSAAAAPPAAAGSSNAAAPPADPSAAAESSGGAGVPAAASAPAEPSGGAVSPAAAGAESSAGVPTAAVAASSSSTDLVPARGDGRLRRALVGLAREDAVAAGALLVGLLPAQGAVLHGTLTYDLTVRGVGTFAVFVEDGSARVVRLSRRRPRGQAPFHLSAEPLALAELLAGERRKVGRFRRKAKVSGRRKRAQELTALRDARLSLADAVEAGARLEPALVFQALPFVVEPEWTCGHRFTVAQQIVELAPREWHVAVHDGRPLRVVERSAGAPADATVTMTRAAFDRLLRDERPALADRPVVRGDREAVAALKRWTDLARGV